MDDSKTTIKDLKNHVATLMSERDWAQFHSPKNMAMSIAVEAGELMELFIYATLEESEQIVIQKKQQFEHELADVMIACLELANRTNIDLSTIIATKIEEIKKKYPVEKSKGKWTKYTDQS